MAYARNGTWQNGPGGGTPIYAEKLEHMEEGIDAAADAGDNANQRLDIVEPQLSDFFDALPLTGTPAAATDLATALTLLNDLRTKLIAAGLIS